MLWLPNKTSNYPSERHAARFIFEPALSVPPTSFSLLTWGFCCGPVVLLSSKMLHFKDCILVLISTASVVHQTMYNKMYSTVETKRMCYLESPGRLRIATLNCVELSGSSLRTECTFGTACQVPCCVVQYCKMLSTPTMLGIQTVNPLNKSLVQSVFMMNSE